MTKLHYHSLRVSCVHFRFTLSHIWFKLEKLECLNVCQWTSGYCYKSKFILDSFLFPCISSEIFKMLGCYKLYYWFFHSHVFTLVTYLALTRWEFGSGWLLSLNFSHDHVILWNNIIWSALLVIHWLLWLWTIEAMVNSRVLKEVAFRVKFRVKKVLLLENKD